TCWTPRTTTCWAGTRSTSRWATRASTRRSSSSRCSAALVPEHVRVDGAGLAPVEGGEGAHVGLRELEAEHVQVLAQPFAAIGLGDGHVAELNVPAQHHLGGRAGQPLRDANDSGLPQQLAALADRRPRLRHDAVPG